jgi:hypothetical protein
MVLGFESKKSGTDLPDFYKDWVQANPDVDRLP